MKRRNFVVGGMSLVGVGLPLLARAQSLPCPPPAVRVGGGTGADSTCSQPGDLSWVPPVGQVATIGLNTLSSQAPVINGNQTDPSPIMTAWSGMVYARALGTYGSLVIYGGGHNDYPYNEVYRFDVATRSWSRMTDPAYPLYTGPDGYLVDSTYGEYYTSASGSGVRSGQVSADHTYGHMVWLPSGSIGGDSAGYFFSPGVTASVTVGQRQTSWPHFVPLSAPAWTRGAAALSSPPGYGPALYDSFRKRVVLMPSSYYNQTLRLWNCQTQTASSLAISAPGTLTYYATAGYDSDNDLYMNACNYSDRQASGRSVLELVNPSTGAMKYASVSGVSIASMDVGGWDWVQPWKAWVYYPGSGQTVYVLKSPSDPWNGTWVMSTQTMGGDTAQSKSSAPHYSRFRYVEPAGCFLWASQTSARIQAFNLAPA